MLASTLLGLASLGQLSDRPHWLPDDETRFSRVVALAREGSVLCSGSVVASRWVLSARHCVGVSTVLLGADAEEPRELRRIVGHRLPRNPHLDVALFRLDRAIELTPLPRRSYHDGEAPTVVTVVGYGHRDPRRAGRRRSTQLRARGWGCMPKDAGRLGCSPGRELVVPRQGGADTCRGDSGGPVLERFEGDWRLVAVTSRSTRDPVVRCGDGGIYVRADAIAKWLESQIADAKPQQVLR